LPHTEEIVDYSTRRSVAAVCRGRAAAVLYLSLGLSEEMAAIAAGLDGLSLLSVAASASYVSKGAVLGFDAESGKPKLVVNLAQARRQKVAFKPELSPRPRRPRLLSSSPPRSCEASASVRSTRLSTISLSA
jgi:hypothetical protein